MDLRDLRIPNLRWATLLWFIGLFNCSPLVAEDSSSGNHWSFQPVIRPKEPRSENGNAVDAFVREKLRSLEIEPSSPSKPQNLVRRLHLVVHGIPPKPEVVDEFLSDDSPDKWANLVEQVLASPRFGERITRSWLDLVRFAESNGFETNRERPTAYHYRDYVIESFNQDKPYDLFIKEQLAGDTLDADIATGFLVAGPHDIVKSPDPVLTATQRQDELTDMVNTTGTAFLGLTLGCARCHDHKFDPISQKDFYAMQAVFAGVTHGERAVQKTPVSENPNLRNPVNAKRNIEEFAPHQTRLIRFKIHETNSGEPCVDELLVLNSQGKNLAHEASLSSSGNFSGNPKHQLDHLTDGKFGNSNSWIADKESSWVQIELSQPSTVSRIEWSRDREGQFGDRLATRYEIESSLDGVEWRNIASSNNRAPIEGFGPKAWLANFTEPGKTHLLHRGEALSKREEVGPGIPETFGTLKLAPDAAEKERRAAIANWIANRENPLTSRVMVNRLWQFVFGSALVDTPSDFGGNGASPSHPELLDWLAAEFVENNWSTKHILRLLLNSQTFQQESKSQYKAIEKDSDNRYLWRFSPRRLEAEAIRDTILMVSGSLNLSEVGGPGFSLLEVTRENVVHYYPKEEIGPAEKRRMIYMTKIRQEQDGVFGLFDCPDGNQVVAKRSRSTTPLQALNLFNSRFMIQQAEELAAVLKSSEEPVDAVFRILYGRAPLPSESLDANRFISGHGLRAYCRAMLNTNELLFIF